MTEAHKKLEDMSAQDGFRCYIYGKKKIKNLPFAYSMGYGGIASGGALPWVFLDITGTSLFVIGVVSILGMAAGTLTGGISGVFTELARYKKLGNKNVTVKNYAGQTVSGKACDVFYLMALQEKLFEVGRNSPFSAKIRARMIEQRANVKVKGGGAYYILDSKEGIKGVDLSENIAQLENFGKKDYKAAHNKVLAR